MGVTINKKSTTTTEPPPLNGEQPKPPGGLNAFYWYQIFALDSAVVEVQEMFSSHGSLLTNAMYHHAEAFRKLSQRKVMNLLNDTPIPSPSPLAEMAMIWLCHFYFVTP